MAYFPFFVNIAGKEALVAGGGKVAARKVKTLLDFGANVKVVSPEAVPELRKLAESGTVCLFLRKYRPEDLNSAALVIAATGDKKVNRQISRGAQEKLIPVNAVDNPELCTFFSLPSSGAETSPLASRLQEATHPLRAMPGRKLNLFSLLRAVK